MLFFAVRFQQLVQSEFLDDCFDDLQVVVETHERVLVIRSIFRQYIVVDGKLRQSVLAIIRVIVQGIQQATTEHRAAVGFLPVDEFHVQRTLSETLHVFVQLVGQNFGRYERFLGELFKNATDIAVESGNQRIYCPAPFDMASAIKRAMIAQPEEERQRGSL